MAEIAAESTDFSGGLDTYVPSIDGPREGTESTEQAAGAVTETADESTEQSSETADPAQEATGEELPSYSKNPVLNELINKFAKDHPELDPANAAHLKILNRMANQEKFIRELKAKGVPQDGLTEYERGLMKPADAPAAAAERPADASRAGAQEPTSYFEGDPGVGWKSPNDAYAQMAKAWSKEGGPDYDLINKVEQGIFHRRAEQSGYVTAQQAEQMLDKVIQSRLGDVLPHVRETVEMQRSEANKEFAIAELEKLPEWAGIRELYKEADGEPPLVINGEQHPNTPLNRILMENPEILDINVRHKDDIAAERLTYMARYKAVLRASQRGKIDEKKANALLQAGVKSAQRTSSDRTRQGINSGTTGGLPNGKKTGSFVQGLVDEAPASFSSL